MAFIRKITKNINGVNITLMKKIDSELASVVVKNDGVNLDSIYSRLDSIEEIFSSNQQDEESSEIFLSFDGLNFPTKENGGTGVIWGDPSSGFFINRSELDLIFSMFGIGSTFLWKDINNKVLASLNEYGIFSTNILDSEVVVTDSVTLNGSDILDVIDQKIQTNVWDIINIGFRTGLLKADTIQLPINTTHGKSAGGLFFNGLASEPYDGYSIKFGKDDAPNNNYGYNYGNVTDYAMRFTSGGDVSKKRGWTWTSVGYPAYGNNGYLPVMSLDLNGQLTIRSGITFELFDATYSQKLITFSGEIDTDTLDLSPVVFNNSGLSISNVILAEGGVRGGDLYVAYTRTNPDEAATVYFNDPISLVTSPTSAWIKYWGQDANPAIYRPSTFAANRSFAVFDGVDYLSFSAGTYYSGSTPLAQIIVAAAGGAVNLNDIIDVNITSPQNIDLLTYDSVAGEWVNSAHTFAGGGVAPYTNVIFDNITATTLTTTGASVTTTELYVSSGITGGELRNFNGDTLLKAYGILSGNSGSGAFYTLDIDSQNTNNISLHTSGKIASDYNIGSRRTMSLNERNNEDIEDTKLYFHDGDEWSGASIWFTTGDSKFNFSHGIKTSANIIVYGTGGTIEYFTATGNTKEDMGSILIEAINSAGSGDTVYVGPGTYFAKNLLRDQLNYYFEVGSRVEWTGTSLSSEEIFDDNGENYTFNVDGYGEFYISGAPGNKRVFNFEGTTSGNIRCKKIEAGNGVAIRLAGTGGEIVTYADEIISADGTFDNLSTNTILRVFSRKVVSTGGFVVEMDGGSSYIHGVGTNAILQSESSNPVEVQSHNGGCYINGFTIIAASGEYAVNLGTNYDVNLSHCVLSSDTGYIGGPSTSTAYTYNCTTINGEINGLVTGSQWVNFKTQTEQYQDVVFDHITATTLTTTGNTVYVLDDKVEYIDRTLTAGDQILDGDDWRFNPYYTYNDISMGIKDYTIFYDDIKNRYHIIGINADGSLASNFDARKKFIWVTSDNLSGQDSFQLFSGGSNQDGFLDTLSGYNDGQLAHILWAPHLIQNNGKYYMFYTGVEYREDPPVSLAYNKQKIFVAESTDIENWKRDNIDIKFLFDGSILPESTWDISGTYTGDCRDPFVIKNDTDDTWAMFYCTRLYGAHPNTPAYPGNPMAIAVATSTTLTDGWTNIGWIPATASGDTTPTDWQGTSESPCVFKGTDGNYNLIVSWGASSWASNHRLYTSTTLLDLNSYVRSTELDEFANGFSGYAGEILAHPHVDNLWMFSRLTGAPDSILFYSAITFDGSNNILWTGNTAYTQSYSTSSTTLYNDVWTVFKNHLIDDERHVSPGVVINADRIGAGVYRNGTHIFPEISSTVLSANTIYSGSVDLSSLIGGGGYTDNDVEDFITGNTIDGTVTATNLISNNNIFVNYLDTEGRIYFMMDGDEEGAFILAETGDSKFIMSIDTQVVGYLSATTIRSTGVIYSGGVDIATLMGGGSGYVAGDSPTFLDVTGRTFVVTGNTITFPWTNTDKQIIFGRSSGTNTITFNENFNRIDFSNQIYVVGYATFNDRAYFGLSQYIDGNGTGIDVYSPGGVDFSHSIDSPIIYSGGVDLATIIGSAGGGYVAGDSPTFNSLTSTTVVITGSGVSTLKLKGNSTETNVTYSDISGYLGIDRPVRVSTTFSAGTDITAEDDVLAHGSMYINDLGSSSFGDLYFYANGSRTGSSIRYNDTADRYEFTHGILVSGIENLSAQTVLSRTDMYINHQGNEELSYLYFHDGVDLDGAYLGFDTANTKFSLSSPLDVNGTLYVDTSSESDSTLANFVTNNQNGKVRIGNDTNQYGYYWEYVGTGSGIANYLDFYTENQTGTHILTSRIDQNGLTNWYTQHNFSSIDATSLSGDTIYSGNQELSTVIVYDKSLSIYEPRADENITLMYCPTQVTIKDVYAVLRGSSSQTVTWGISSGSSRNSMSSVFTDTTTSITTADSNSVDRTIPASTWLSFVTTATGGTIDEFSVMMTYTKG